MNLSKGKMSHQTNNCELTDVEVPISSPDQHMQQLFKLFKTWLWVFKFVNEEITVLLFFKFK